MTCSGRVPGAHIYCPAGAPDSFKRRLGCAFIEDGPSYLYYPRAIERANKTSLSTILSEDAEEFLQRTETRKKGDADTAEACFNVQRDRVDIVRTSNCPAVLPTFSPVAQLDADRGSPELLAPSQVAPLRGKALFNDVVPYGDVRGHVKIGRMRNERDMEQPADVATLETQRLLAECESLWAKR
jgi:hypothetical protein